MTDEEWRNPASELAKNEVAFDYIKSQDFKVAWADGVVGSATPNGLVHFAVYSERQAIPRRQVFELDRIDDENAALGREVMEKRLSRGSIVREMSVDVLMTQQTARSLANWLLEQVAAMNKDGTRKSE